MRFFGSLILFGVLLGSAIAAEDARPPQGAEAWLAKMTDSAKRLNYSGEFVYYHSNSIDSMYIAHAYSDAQERERLQALNGEHHEIIREDDRVRYVLPGSNVLPLNAVKQRLAANFAARIPEQLNRLQRLYHVTTVENDRIAGRAAQLIAVVPVDQYRFGYLIWADEKTGLLLRADLLDEDNKPIEHFMFTNVVFKNSIDDKELTQQVSGTEIDWQISVPQGTPQEVGIDQGWIVGELPSGFHYKPVSRELPEGGGDGIEHMMYTDGLASVSVFVEALTAENPGFNAQTRVGSISSYARVVDDHQVTVVGEVPLATTMLIGDSVRVRVSAP